MRSMTNKMLVSLVGVALATPFFVIAVIVGARVVSLAESAQDDLLLIGLAAGGAVVSMINGFGRRTGQVEQADKSRARKEDAASHGFPSSTSAIEV
jgi:hypothetical protein